MTGLGSPIQHGEPEERRCQDVLMLAASVWVIISPWFNGAREVPVSQMSAQIAGGLLFICATWALARQRSTLPEYCSALVGCWLIATPFFAHGVALERIQLWVIGTLVVVLSMWSATIARHERGLGPRGR
ncbi:MAG TPA: SPW repeat protein [Candidatus Acidoferrum sp.]|nr:SPW repeat protein [Candidatus Acidoferrum sp.]